ncbi:MAG: 2,3-bisphosphoglycerate-independent phosphoglycerate mutase [Desulfovermiculus sp.]|nr:2,3-bisphosphoglycerate-independent phosphoglycerate mutase [Desulfovermiculus sp.]
MTTYTPTLLLILDGWGLGETNAGNAVDTAHTPNMDRILATAPWSSLACSGEAVGLPSGQMGNSEVGHLNIGAGRTVFQDIVRIDAAIADGSFFSNPTLLDLMGRIKEHGSTLHLLGLVSDGGVHSQQDHLYALIRMARDQGLDNVVVHAFLDGRDTPPSSGADYIRRLQDRLQEIGVGRIGTVSGRYYAMDRDKRWERTALAYAALVQGQGRTSPDPVQAVEKAYARGETDEFVEPTIILDAHRKPTGRIQDRDGLFFFNFRADRIRQMVRALTEPDFDQFDVSSRPFLGQAASMTQYDAHFDLPVAFAPQHMTNILGQVCAKLGFAQLRLAETEKYAHVTYFFNGGGEEPFPGEQRILIPSPQEVATYDQKPEMSVYAVTDTLIQEWERHTYTLVVCNFANLDMVGHSGNFKAAVKACEAVDDCLGRVMHCVLESKGRMLVTADHGNAEVMLDPKGGIQTAHSQNPVPFVWLEKSYPAAALRSQGILGDIAPTILDLWGVEQPKEMTGQSLVQR